MFQDFLKYYLTIFIYNIKFKYCQTGGVVIIGHYKRYYMIIKQIKRGFNLFCENS